MISPSIEELERLPCWRQGTCIIDLYPAFCRVIYLTSQASECAIPTESKSRESTDSRTTYRQSVP